MNDDGLPLVRYSTRSTGPCECSATARLPSHSPTNCQTYKPDEGVAPANEQRVASIHHDERVGLTGRGNHMNQACARNDTIDAGNHHGRPQYRQQYRPFLQFLTTQERNVIWLLLAIPGWLKFGIHLNAAFMSITGLLGVLATLGAIAIAFGIKRIPWRTPLRILIASYWFSFGVGVVQWGYPSICISSRWPAISRTSCTGSTSMKARCGVVVARSSCSRSPAISACICSAYCCRLCGLCVGATVSIAKRLRNLIVVYAIGSVMMQAGTRIVLDSVVALLVAIIVHNSWCDKKQRVRGIAQLLGAVMLGLLGVLADSRLSSIAENGAEGDGSFFARIYQSLDPICGLLAHPWTVLTGYGAGNIINAVWAGAKHAERLLNGLGMNGSAAVGFATGMNADTVWTMCAYTSVVAEYGLIGLILLVIASIVSMTRVFDTAAAGHGVWNKTVICWLVLIVYLYIQCENYAFAALPLFIFAASKLRK